MDKKLGQLLDAKIIAIARKVPVDEIVDAAEALYAGGIRALEITFDQASETCIKDTCNSIAAVKAQMGDRMIIGAGTVLSVEQAENAAGAGADFILSPDVKVDVIKEVKRLEMISIPGAFTPTEITTAYEAGADIVKLFPAGIFGIPYFKAIRGPINHIPLMAVGGVNEKNICEFIDAGFCGCGIGSNLVRNDLIKEGKFAELTNIAKSYVNQILNLR